MVRAVLATVVVVALLVAGRSLLVDDPEPAAPDAAAVQRQCVADLPVDVKLAQKIMLAGFTDTLAAQADAFARYDVGGVILMDAAPADVVSSFVAAQRVPPFVATDQEGGTVQRYPSDPALPSAVAMARLGADEAYRLYAEDARRLHETGITTNFAPVAGVRGDADPLPGRMYSGSPDVVVALAGQAVRASRDNGVTAVVKHFPGLGTTVVNTDLRPVRTAPFAQLQRRDLRAFERLAALGSDLMMSNARVPGLTEDEPAGLSAAAVDAARSQYGFADAVIYTDSLTAGAVDRPVPEAAAAAWAADVDVALVVQAPSAPLAEDYVEPMIAAGRAALSAGDLTEARLDASVGRILQRKGVDPCGLAATP